MKGGLYGRSVFIEVERHGLFLEVLATVVMRGGVRVYLSSSYFLVRFSIILERSFRAEAETLIYR